MFPSDPLVLLAEMQIDGIWLDITDDVQVSGGVSITTGRPDEGTRCDAASAAFTLDNAGGKYSPRNPVSPYYGKIGRNTPVRFGIIGPNIYLALPGDGADLVSTPDDASLDITGDLDVRMDLKLTNWRKLTSLASKYVDAGDQRSWALWLNANGKVTFSWSPDGTLASRLLATSTVPVPAPAWSRQSLRAVLDVDNGSGGWTVRFYTGDYVAVGPWTQLGAPIVGAGATSVYASTAPVEVGGRNESGAAPSCTGAIHGFELRAGDGGPVMAEIVTAALTPGSTTWTDSAGRPWSLQGATEITTRIPRFVGEMSALPPRWDVAEQQMLVPVQAAGIQRRLTQSDALQGSVLRRALTRNRKVVAYWPLEDGPDTRTAASGLAGGQPMTIVGRPDMAAYTAFAASEAVPVLQGAALTGSVPAYTGSAVQLTCLLAIPASGEVSGAPILSWSTTGTAARWELQYRSGGGLAVRVRDVDGNPVATPPVASFAVDGRVLMVIVELYQTGPDIAAKTAVLEEGDATGLEYSMTMPGLTLGQLTTVTVNQAKTLTGTAVGHVMVQAAVPGVWTSFRAFNANRGETAGRRIERLCTEEGIPFSAIGDLAATALMGAQVSGGKLTDLLEEAAATDGGMLFEPRDILGLAYRTRESLYNQRPRLELDYGGGHLVPPLDPTDDDQHVRNDVTVSRPGGSSARAVLEEGDLSVQPPPGGVGRYETSITVSAWHDAHLPDHASWRLHTATVDETRWPLVTLNVAKLIADAHYAQVDQLTELGLADLVTITRIPAAVMPGQVRQLALGLTEYLSEFDWRIELMCVPAAPYSVAVADSLQPGSRYGPVDTVLAAAIDPVATGVDITTPTGPLWSTTASGYQIVVGGEVMTVTAVSAPTGITQTLTVERSVNGVVKPHAAGGVVVLAQPAVYAL